MISSIKLLNSKEYPASLYNHNVRDILFKYLDKNFTSKDDSLFDILNNKLIQPWELVRLVVNMFGINDPRVIVEKWVNKIGLEFCDNDWNNNIWDIEFPYVRNVEPRLLSLDVIAGVDPSSDDPDIQIFMTDHPNTPEELIRNWAILVAEKCSDENLMLDVGLMDIKFSDHGVN